MPVLTPDEIRTFLAEPGHLLRIATVDADGQPWCTPVWFVCEDDKLYVTPRERSVWRRHLEANPRACMVVDETPLPYRKVIVRGSVEVVHPLGEDDVWRDRYRRITERYIPPAAADRYLTSTWDEPRALLALPLSGATTWRMPVGEEPAEGSWASRYYHAEDNR